MDNTSAHLPVDLDLDLEARAGLIELWVEDPADTLAPVCCWATTFTLACIGGTASSLGTVSSSC